MLPKSFPRDGCLSHFLSPLGNNSEWIFNSFLMACYTKPEQHPRHYSTAIFPTSYLFQSHHFLNLSLAFYQSPNSEKYFLNNGSAFKDD